MHKSWLLLVLILAGCSAYKDPPLVQYINQNWSFSTLNGKEWQTATVPGNIFTDLLNHQAIPDPFIGANEALVQWVSDSTWIYKTTFHVPQDILRREHLELHLEGLDTYATIYLNGHQKLQTRNAFEHHTIDVTGDLTSENELVIQFEPTHRQEKKAQQAQPFSLPGGARVFTRKPQFHYGWDWGPTLNGCGIWKEVYIKAYDGPSIANVYIELLEQTTEEAHALAHVELTQAVSHPTVIQIEVDGERFEVVLGPGENTTNFEGRVEAAIPLRIQNPTLWWPHNLGEPYLYTVNVRLLCNDVVADTRNIPFGIRKVELVAKDDSIGSGFFFKINDVPVYMKGANYIPQNIFQNRVGADQYLQLLTDVKAANMNMLRVWGGGQYERDLFYDLCDEMGVLLWHDFMFACAMYPGDSLFLASVKTESRQQLQRLQNHASIVLWCGNNEGSEGWHRWGWQEGRSELEKQEMWSQYCFLFDTLLHEQVSAYTSVPYWASSPRFGRGNPRYENEGDAHDWWVWHDGYPFEHYERHVPRFMSEFGFQSFPNEEVLMLMHGDDSVAMLSPAMQAHQKHPRGFAVIEEYMRRDYPVPEKINDYAYVSQLVQARGVGMGMEAHRRAMPRNMGSLFWQLNDCWPSVSWSSIDYSGEWKALHFQAQRAFNNPLISFYENGDSLEVHLINDALQPIQGELSLNLMNFQGEPSFQMTQSAEIPALESVVLRSLSMEALPAEKCSLVLLASFGDLRAHYFFCSPKDLPLQEGTLKWSMIRLESGFEITLESEVLQKDLFLSAQVPGRFSDNFFDLMPHEKKVVQFNTGADSIHLSYRSLNSLIAP